MSNDLDQDQDRHSVSPDLGQNCLQAKSLIRTIQINADVIFYIQEVFHVYLNNFEIAITHLFLIIFCNN